MYLQYATGTRPIKGEVRHEFRESRAMTRHHPLFLPSGRHVDKTHLSRREASTGERNLLHGDVDLNGKQDLADGICALTFIL